VHKLHKIQESFETRFWKYVRKTEGCWLWTGFLSKCGRGQLRLGRASEGAMQSARASWIVHFGHIPDGMSVLHHCDNPSCVRPDHLYLGTQQDNMRDKHDRKRHHLLGRGHLIAGERNPNSTLTWGSVAEIRSRHSTGERAVALAKEFGVTKEQVYHVLHNRCWVEGLGRIAAPTAQVSQ